MSNLFEWVAIGDALGLPYEFKISKTADYNHETKLAEEWEARKGGIFYSHIETFSGSTYSDDTQMLMMIARSILSSNHTQHFIKELVAFKDYQQGAGRVTKKSCDLWKKNRSIFTEEYYHARGNGVLMRVQPYSLLQGCSHSEMCKMTFENAILTHGYPVGILPALLYVVALTYLREHSLDETVDIPINDNKTGLGYICSSECGQTLVYKFYT